MTTADRMLAAISDRNTFFGSAVGRTGHAPNLERETLLSHVSADAKRWLDVEDRDGDSWEGFQYPDASVLLVTHVRGNNHIDFWQAFSALDYAIIHSLACTRDDVRL